MRPVFISDPGFLIPRDLHLIKFTWSSLSVEDKIVMIRFTTGLVFGLSVFLLSFFVNPITLSTNSWLASVLVYYSTVIYVAVKYRPLSRFQLYFRGLGTFYATWLLTAILLHEVFTHLGVKT
ncbi:MAG: hypothetical protein QW425_03630 [Desulfurococcaceae archaeon]